MSTKARASVVARAGKLLISSYSITEAGFAVINDCSVAIPDDAADDELGRLVLEALAASQPRVPTPDPSSHPLPAVRKLWKLAGVRSNRAFMEGAREVMITRAADSGPVVINPSHNAGPRMGYVPIEDAAPVEVMPSDDAMVGAAVREALARST